MRARAAFAAMALVVAACAGDDQQTTSAGGSSPAARAARSLPTGTTMALEAMVGINSHANKVGDPVSARVSRDVVSASGATVIPIGAKLSGTVTELSKSTSATSPGNLQLSFTEVRVGQTSRPISMRVTSVATHLATPGVTTEDAATVAVGAAAGAIAGRVIGGDKTGARVGAGAGAVAGAVYANRSRDRDIIMSIGAPIQAVTLESFAMRK